MEESVVVCHSCGKEERMPFGKPPCGVLIGWFIVSQWKGLGSVEQYIFCSLTCLKRWVDAQVPKIPETFLKSFRDENDKGGGSCERK
jgi:hypothetical protein